MAYDVIGNVVDSTDRELKDVIVSDGSQSVKTDADGYYELKTDKTNLTFSKNGYTTGNFDLSKYKNPSSVNADVTLKTIQENSQGNNNIVVGSRKLKPIVIIGLGLLAVVGGYFLYKKYKK